MSGFNEAYTGVPPWDIGRPQAEFVSLEKRGEAKGDVIDVGCGTGEHAIFFASKGHAVLGVDSAPRAIEKAKAKAEKRGSDAKFLVWDALDLGSLGKKFDTATDSGLFHVFSDPDRRAYVSSLSSVLRPGGTLLMLCFSDKEPDWGGPRRITRNEIQNTFSSGWKIDYIRAAIFESASGSQEEEVKAWLSKITRL